MDEVYITDEKFDKTDFNKDPLSIGSYENCSFIYCDFSGTDLSEIKFIDCLFEGCNLSLVKLSGAAFRNVKFRDCKMLGLRFDTCNTFGLAFGFEKCDLGHSSFYGLKIKKTVFKLLQLNDVDFTTCDLTASSFENCDLVNAKFENTNLEKVDFRTAFNYSIDPGSNKIKQARFSLPGIPGLLDKYDILIDPL